MLHTRNQTLGNKVRQILMERGLENPVSNRINLWNDEKHLRLLESKLGDFLTELGLGLNDESMRKTPNRVVKFFINELFYGLDYNNFPEMSTTANAFKYHTPLISKGISVNSTCEHHLVSIHGEAIIAYIPGDSIIGLSKLNRIVDFFASRPQVQERLNRQIFVALQTVLETESVAVAINAKHNCIVTRGVQDNDTKNLTFELGGEFLNNTVLSTSFHNLILHMK